MQVDYDIVIKLVSAVVTALVSAVVKFYLEGKPQLITYLVHATGIPIPPSPQQNVNQGVPPANVQANTHSIVVRNAGKKTAHNVRIGHTFLPVSYRIFPTIQHAVQPGAGGPAEIVVPALVPNEQITISYLYFAPLTFNNINDYVKSDEALAQYINVVPTKQTSRPVAALIAVLLFIGASTILYWLLSYLWGHVTAIPLH